MASEPVGANSTWGIQNRALLPVGRADDGDLTRILAPYAQALAGDAGAVAETSATPRARKSQGRGAGDPAALRD